MAPNHGPASEIQPTVTSQDIRLRLLHENLISFAQAATLFPSFRRGRPVSPSCIWRWSRHGVRLDDGQIVKLETLKVAGRHLTTTESVYRFIAAQQPNLLPIVEGHVIKRNERSASRTIKNSEESLRRLQSKQKGKQKTHQRSSATHDRNSTVGQASLTQNDKRDDV